MIDKRVVIVVGAGGSVPYGFPTGEKLKWAICDGLKRIERKDGSEATKEALADLLANEGFKTEETDRLRDYLRQSAWSSIDEFLSQHKDLDGVGKAAIAGVLMSLENPDQLFDPRDERGNRIGNWYQQLFKTVFSPFEDIEKNNVTFLTYNYDTSLETYLDIAMTRSYAHKADRIQAAINHIPVIHLHGRLVDHKYGKAVGDGTLRRCSEGIHIVTDNIDDNPEFKKAAQVMWEANEIYFIGFGYDPNNLRRLPIESKYPPNSPGSRMGASRPSLNIFGTAFGLAPAKRFQIEHYFRDKGFKINLGDPGEDALGFLRNTLLFGAR
jgi:hypothetical protein